MINTSTKVYKNEQGVDISRALKRFNRKVQKESVIDELNNRKFFVSNGSKKREILKHAKYINKIKSMYMD